MVRILILCFLFTITSCSPIRITGPDRKLSSLSSPIENQTCSELMRGYFRFQEGNDLLKRSLWKRALGIPQRRFSYEDHERVLEYLRDLPYERLWDEVPHTSEGLLAAVKIVTERSHSGMSPLDIQIKLNLFKEASLEHVVRKLSLRGKLEANDLEDFSREIFLISHGPRYKLGDFLKEVKGEEVDFGKLAISRLIQEDLLAKGLLRTFRSYNPEFTNANFLQRFSHSKFGKMALTGLFNLPMLVGTPPLWGPRGAPLRLPSDLAEKILREGMSREIFNGIESDFSRLAQSKVTYEMMRSYYIKGTLLYLSLAAFYDFYLLNGELNEEKEMLKDATEELGGFFNSIGELQEEGVDIFEEETIESGATFCQGIAECLNTLGIDIDPLDFESLPEIRSNSRENYQLCKEVIDPGNHCKR